MRVWWNWVDTPALEAGVERRAGSSPAMRTTGDVAKLVDAGDLKSPGL